MIEASARARLGRAMNTRTTMAGQRLNLHVGEEVDVYRKPDTKDVSGWHCEASVMLQRKENEEMHVELQRRDDISQRRQVHG